MIISITGPRPNKIGCAIIPNPTYNYIYKNIEAKLQQYTPEKVISGMCIGVDQWFAWISLKLEIPFIAAVPFLGQEKLWNDKERRMYDYLMSRAAEIKYVCEPGFSIEKFQRRNEYLVDNCDVLMAVYKNVPGGTKNCVDYAKKVNRKIEYIYL